MTITFTVRKPLNGTDTRRHTFPDQDCVITAWCSYAYEYVSWLDNQDGEQDQAQGHGSTRLEAIADLAQQIREAE
jgi:hypothetical protein